MGPGTRFYRALTGDHWTAGDHLLALVADRLAVLIWQPTKDGAAGKKFPKPLLRPGQEPEKRDNDADGATFGTKGLTIADVDAVFAKFYGGDDVSLSRSVPPTSTSSRQRGDSKRTSPANSRRSKAQPQSKVRKPAKP